MNTNNQSVLDKALAQPSLEMFRFETHGIGAAGYAAKRIAQGETVSFDIWNRIKDDNDFLTIKREFVKRVYIGLSKLDDEPEGRDTALRVSHCSDLQAHQTHSLIASWQGNDITGDPVFIAAEIVSYMMANKYDNYFIN